jgi:raffinose/stachyose/melibiose transport system permease protein
VLLLPFLLVAIVPIYILLISAFKTQPDILASPLTFQLDRLTVDNVVAAVQSPQLDIVASFLRTALITIASVALSTFTAALLSYVVSRVATVWTYVLYAVIAAGILIPSQVLLIPVIRIFQLLSIDGTLFALILYMAALQIPYAVFLYSGFFSSIPKELDEAAYVDGAGPFRTFWSVIFPVLRPATASIAIFNGLGAFNNFIDPLIILGPTGGKTITTGIFSAVGQYNTDYASVFGNLLVAITPVVIAYFFLQRQFIEGLSEGSVKS